MFFRSVSNFFWKTNSTANFLHSEWRNLHSEWGFLHSFFSDVFWTFFLKKKLYREFSPFRMEKSPFWMEISPFTCFSEVFCFFNISTEIFLHSSVFFERWFEHFFKNISTYNCLHPEWRFGDFSIHFFSETFFVEKQTPQIIFSIQNGEISILNGDFSIQILFRSVLIFF